MVGEVHLVVHVRDGGDGLDAGSGASAVVSSARVEVDGTGDGRSVDNTGGAAGNLVRRGSPQVVVFLVDVEHSDIAAHSQHGHVEAVNFIHGAVFMVPVNIICSCGADPENVASVRFNGLAVSWRGVPKRSGHRS